MYYGKTTGCYTPSNSTYKLVGGVPWRRSSTPAKILNGINLAKEMFLPIRIHNLDLRSSE